MCNDGRLGGGVASACETRRSAHTGHSFYRPQLACSGSAVDLSSLSFDFKKVLLFPLKWLHLRSGRTVSVAAEAKRAPAVTHAAALCVRLPPPGPSSTRPRAASTFFASALLLRGVILGFFCDLFIASDSLSLAFSMTTSYLM